MPAPKGHFPPPPSLLKRTSTLSRLHSDPLERFVIKVRTDGAQPLAPRPATAGQLTGTGLTPDSLMGAMREVSDHLRAVDEWRAARTLQQRRASIPGGGRALIPGGGRASIPGGGRASIPGGGRASIPGGGRALIPGGGRASIPGGGPASAVQQHYAPIPGGGAVSFLPRRRASITGAGRAFIPGGGPASARLSGRAGTGGPRKTDPWARKPHAQMSGGWAQQPSKSAPATPTLNDGWLEPPPSWPAFVPAHGPRPPRFGGHRPGDERTPRPPTAAPLPRGRFALAPAQHARRPFSARS
jgi:hypothetical protein